MKQPFQLVSPDRLQIRQGGGCLALFGLPFFAAGVFMCLGTIGVVPVRTANDLARPVMALMGLAFTAVGGALVFGRSWTIVDRTQRQVVKQLGLLIPMRESIVPLDRYTAVTLAFVPGDSDSNDKFPIALKAETGPDLPLCSFTTYPDARACAAAIADHLHVDLEDASTDHPVRRPAGQADLPLQDRLRTEAMTAAGSDDARPSDARSEVTRELGVTTVVMPARPLPAIVLAGVVVAVAIAFVFGSSASAFVRRTDTPDPVAWFFLAFLALFIVIPMVTVLNAFVRSRRGATIVDVSREGLRIRERGAWRTRLVRSIDAADILDVDYSSRESMLASARRSAEQQVLQSRPTASTTMTPRVERMVTALTRYARAGRLTVKTRTGLIALAQGLDDAEVRYLRGVIVRALIE